MGDALPLAPWASAAPASTPAYTPPAMGSGPSAMAAVNASYQDSSQSPAASPMPKAPWANGGSTTDPAATTAQTPPTALASPPVTGGPSSTPIKPTDFTLSDFKPETLKQVASDGGLDVSKIDPGYWDSLSQHYQDVSHPGALEKAKEWLSSSALGHFLQGANDAGVVNPAAFSNTNPQMAETMKADEFFNKNIQTRIIDKGANIDDNGNYHAATATKVGEVAGDPENVLLAAGGVGALRYGASAAKLGAGAYSAWAAANPNAARIVGRLAIKALEGTALATGGGTAYHYLKGIL